MTINFKVTSNPEGLDTVVAYDPSRDNPLLVADSSHPSFDTIVERLMANDETVFALFDIGSGLALKFAQVSERYSYNGSEILFDGDPVHDVVASQMLRALEEGLDSFKPLAAFGEKLAANPNPHSREQLYKFLAAHKFQITPDGDVVAYKGVVRRTNGVGKVQFFSTTSSRVPNAPSAFVDGFPLPARSAVTYQPGTVVTLPRSEVLHDPTQTCERGLHVGTWDYAKGYGSTVLEVHVNPRDYVSVPNDVGGRKARVCRIKVIREVSRSESPETDAVVLEPATSTYDAKSDVGARVVASATSTNYAW